MSIHRLLVLGNSSLVDASGNQLLSVVSQPRRYALLLHLALGNAGGTVRRDALLGLFWPELTDHAGRHALRQALFHLRRSLGSAAVTGVGQELVGIDPAVVKCDAVEFRAALTRGSFEEAVRLYRGDLLPGFHLDHGSPQFDQWLEHERGVLRRLACDAAWQAAEAAARSGNTAAAGSYARACAALAQWDDTILHQCLSLLVRLGDRAGAVVVYEGYAKGLWEEYEAVPSDRCREVLSPSEHDRAVGVGDVGLQSDQSVALPTPMHPAPDVGSSETTEPARSTPQQHRPARARRLRAFQAAALGVMLVTPILVLGSGRGPAAADVPALTRVLIEPVQDYTDMGEAHRQASALTALLAGSIAADGNAEAVLLEHRLAKPGRTVREFLERDSTYILRAGLLDGGGPVRLSVVLVDGKSGATIGHSLVSAVGPEGFMESLAMQVATFVDQEISSALDRERLQRDAPNQSALALVRDAIRDRAAVDSLRQEQAIEAARLRLHKADSVLRVAQERAPEWPEPTIQRAENQLDLMWLVLLTGIDTEEAHAAIRRAHAYAESLIGKEGDNVAALELRAVANYWLWRTGTWQSELRPEDLSRSIEGDLRAVIERRPTSGRAWNLLSAMLFSRGEFAEAYWAAERAHRADIYGEYAADIAARLFTTALEANHSEAAGRWCREIGRRQRRAPVYAYCRMVLLASEPGDSASSVVADAQRVLKDGLASPWAARLEMLYATILARDGQTEQALHAIERARAAGSGDPELAPLEAWARLRLNDPDNAADLLSRYVSEKPHTRSGILKSYRFVSLH